MSWADKVVEAVGYESAYSRVSSAKTFSDLPDGRFSSVGVSLEVFPTPYRGMPLEMRSAVVETKPAHRLWTTETVLEGYSWPRLVEKRGSHGIFRNEYGSFTMVVNPEEPIKYWRFED